MATIGDLLKMLQLIAPSEYAFSWDKIGLQVGDDGARLRKGVVSLDRSLSAIKFAAVQNADVLVAHHPLIFSPIATVDTRSVVGQTILELVRSNVAFVAAHTNWDCARGGINDTLAELLGLQEYVPFGEAAAPESLKLNVFVPTAHLEVLIAAASNAGAGVIGAYKRCAFWGSGHGTFEPQTGAYPSIGHAGSRESVEELKLEMILPSSARSAVESSIRAAHPYEEPAIDFVHLASGAQMPIGRIGATKQASLKSFTEHVERILGTKCWTWGDPNRKISRVAVVGGGADDEWRAAKGAGADVLVTGEVKQHIALECVESDFAIIAAGHYATEQPGCEALCSRLSADLSDVDWQLFTPAPGSSGRPI